MLNIIKCYTKRILKIIIKPRRKSYYKKNNYVKYIAFCAKFNLKKIGFGK